MTDLECIEDIYPELRFWGIEVESAHYHGHIQGRDVYINTLQPDIDWLKTAIHEGIHFETDEGDCSDTRSFIQLRNEGWVARLTRKRLAELFGC